MKCFTAEIKHGKMYLRSSKNKNCKKQKQNAQELLDSVKINKIIIK